MKLVISWSRSMTLILVLVLSVFYRVEAQQSLQIVFTKTPSNISSESSAGFEFTFRDQTGNDPCGNCSIRCKLDEGIFQSCDSRGSSYVNLLDGSHTFEVAVNTSTGLRARTSYSWIVDTVPPTAIVNAGPAFTNAYNLTVDIRFTEPCNATREFACNSSSCDLVVYGPATVAPSTFEVLEQGLHYSLLVTLSNATSGRVVITTAKKFCRDAAGNIFTRSDNSTSIIHFDRNPVTVNLYTAISDFQVIINNEARTIHATNKLSDLVLYLDFSEPITNTTEELRSCLQTTTGIFQPFNRKSHGNRRFAFLLTNISKVAVLEVSFLSTKIISRAGTFVQETTPVTFMFDQRRPEVQISTTSPAKTKERLVPLLIQFSKPVFSFQSSALTVLGGRMKRFREITKTTYYAEILVAMDITATMMVKENRISDIAGNTNFASNVIHVRHYTTPSISVALSSFTNAGLLATVLASGALSVSSASLAAAGALSSRTVGSIMSDPSRNLLGMAGHLQVFALTDWLATSLPIEYRETIRGLKWLIPHAKLPAEKQHELSENDFRFDTSSSVIKNKQGMHNLLVRKSSQAIEYQSWSNIPISGSMNMIYPHDYHILERELGTNASVFGPPLSISEYQFYFVDRSASSQESLSDLIKDRDNGWKDFKMNTFWLVIVVGPLLFLHIILLQFLRWRTKTSIRGALSIPRLELFFLIFSLPCLCQASAFVIKGATTTGIIVGVLLLAIPTAFLLSLILFLFVAVLMGTFVQYKEIKQDSGETSWVGKALAVVVGRNATGKWVRKEGVSATFLPKFGLLFEDRRGPVRYIVLDGRDANQWVESGSNGIGRMRALHSDDENEDTFMPPHNRVLGSIRTAYILLDISRRIAFGIVFGIYHRFDQSRSQISIVFALTAGQLFYLIFSKPYIQRGVQAVESFSLLAEAGVFAAALVLLLQGHPWHNQKGVGIAMLAFLLTSFAYQLMNEWYALMKQLLRLAPSDDQSLKLGLKMLAKGLLLPFIPRSKWSKFITPRPLELQTGFVPVVAMTPSPDLQRSRLEVTTSPVYDPGSPSLVDPRTASFRPGQKPGNQVKPRPLEGKKTKGSKADPKSTELKMLRELAKASFPGTKRDMESSGANENISVSLVDTPPGASSSAEERGKEKSPEIQLFIEDTSDTSSSGSVHELPPIGATSSQPKRATSVEMQEVVMREASTRPRPFEER